MVTFVVGQVELDILVVGILVNSRDILAQVKHKLVAGRPEAEADRWELRHTLAAKTVDKRDFDPSIRMALDLVLEVNRVLGQRSYLLTFVIQMQSCIALRQSRLKEVFQE